MILLPVLLVGRATAAFVETQDENGPNDVPGQKDLNLHAVDTAGLPASLQVYWNWDETGVSGNNSLDACTLFDTDSDGKANFAVCATAKNNPATFQSRTVYTCGDDRVDRCSSPIAPVASPASTCGVLSPSGTDPFSGNGKSRGDSFPNDTRGSCTIQLADVGASSAVLINTCSYPSQQPNSDPSDCVLIPRDAFLKIVKVLAGTNVDSSTASFPFTLDGNAAFTATGSDLESDLIPIVTANNAKHNAFETSVPSDWDFTSASCAGAGDSNGSASGMGVVDIDAQPDNVVTCTFTNTQKPKPQLTIAKSCAQKHATTDRFQPRNNGNDVGSALDCGESTTITLEPNTAWAITEVGAGTPAADLDNYTASFSSDCTGSGLARGAATPTCTITNTLKAAPQLKIEKACPDGPHLASDRFQPQNNGSSVGLNELACGGSQTITLTPDTAYAITEVAGSTTPATSLSNYTTSSSSDCSDANGIPRGTALTTCTITNTLKAAPQLKIEKACPDGAHLASDRFQPRNNGSSTGLNELACGGSQTITLTPDTAYAITEVAGVTTPATNLSNYTTSYSAACTDGNGIPRGTALTTCTITNALKSEPQLTIVKSCPNGAHDNDENFVMKNGESTLATLQCGQSQTVTLAADTAYDVEEMAGSSTSLANYAVDDDSDGDCQDANGIPRGSATPTCTVTNTLEPAPQLKVEKSCPNGAHAATDRFQPQNSGSNVGSALACGGSTTITLVPDAAYSIREAASGTTDLDNYTSEFSAACDDADGLPRGASTPTCTITNTLKTYTVITLVCEGDALHPSSVTLNGSTLSSLSSSVDPTAAELCALGGARFTGKKSGTYTGSVTITP